MPWLKQSDAAASHPIVLAAYELPDADDRILNELFGYVARCATQCAAYEQDYIVTFGTARDTAGSHARFVALAAAAERCGYWIEIEITGPDGERRRAFKLAEEKDLFHMILKDERAWLLKRKEDSRNPDLYVPVRKRDGDACRYCGKTVTWGDNKSGRGGTYDHVVPGDMEVTVETYVVCCRECNGKRQDDPDRTWKTLPAPSEPLYGPATVKLLANHDIIVQPTYTRPPVERRAKKKGAATASSGRATSPPRPPRSRNRTTRLPPGHPRGPSRLPFPRSIARAQIPGKRPSLRRSRAACRSTKALVWMRPGSVRLDRGSMGGLPDRAESGRDGTGWGRTGLAGMGREPRSLALLLAVSVPEEDPGVESPGLRSRPLTGSSSPICVMTITRTCRAPGAQRRTDERDGDVLQSGAHEGADGRRPWPAGVWVVP
ncbi:HNH endonuclease [Arthrobacter woluwensis]|uniref:HNH endonuclease n=1 Tax=Arthrobacter woluwensis TaxID=156980 RepID=UPI001AAEC02D|nr:hypothetical protein [Arthrobacter woluwensis]QTF70599.1 hypothetical protein G8758_00160 [Arthrobacter woluwensis]